MNRYCDADGVLPVLLISPATEAELVRNTNPNSNAENWFMENAEILDPVVEVLSRRRKNMFATALPALLVAPPLRQRFANLLSRNDLPFGVISHDEITPEVTVVPIEVLLEEGSGDDDDSEQFDDSDESGDATMEAAE